MRPRASPETNGNRCHLGTAGSAQQCSRIDRSDTFGARLVRGMPSAQRSKRAWVPPISATSHSPSARANRPTSLANGTAALLPGAGADGEPFEVDSCALMSTSPSNPQLQARYTPPQSDGDSGTDRSRDFRETTIAMMGSGTARWRPGLLAPHRAGLQFPWLDRQRPQIRFWPQVLCATHGTGSVLAECHGRPVGLAQAEPSVGSGTQGVPVCGKLASARAPVPPVTAGTSARC